MSRVFLLDFSPPFSNAVSMLKGEALASGALKTCSDCGVTPALQVLKSAAGYYIGTQCECGPYSRESLYFAIKEAADQALRDGRWTLREPLGL